MLFIMDKNMGSHKELRNIRKYRDKANNYDSYRRYISINDDSESSLYYYDS